MVSTFGDQFAQLLDEVRSSPLDVFGFNIQEGLIVDNSPIPGPFTPSGSTIAIFDPSQSSPFSASSQPITDAISTKKKRTRQDYTIRPQGRNPFGRAGYRRCSICRKWRQPCVYKSIELPCEICKKRGFICGDKKLGPKTESRWLATGPAARPSGQLVLSIPRRRALRPKALPKKKTSRSPTPAGHIEAMSHETIGPQNPSELLIGSESLADSDLTTRRARPGQLVLSISPPLPSPEEERLTPVDDNYLQHFLTKHRVHSEIHVSHRHASILMAPRGLSYLKSSKPLRYAALALASHSKNGPQSIETDRYMTLSYTYIIEAISNSAFADVVYASGIIVELSVLRDEPVSKVLSHLMGMRHGLEEIKFDPSTKDLSEFLWMERSWNTVLRIFYTRLYKRCHHQSSKFVELVESICGVLESSQFILTSNLQAPDGGGRDLVLRERINTLETYVGYCFVRYLLRINDILGDNPQRRATDLLRRVLRQIIDITPCPCLGVNLYIDEIQQLSHYNFTTYPYLRGESESSWEGRYQMSWYFTSMLIDATFSPTSDNSKAVATSAAISLCWLSVLHEINYWVEFRNILLAGLILTKSRYPRENAWIKQRLGQLAVHINGKQDPSTPRKIEAVAAEILDKADRCEKVHDIWTLRSDSGSLWECLLWLASWNGSILGWYCYDAV